mmetsp:Transcript_25007/g.42842  ORF Transcript_25007/g.42842 Transcript_25007/m.42842 type:complete len:213 (+) Transcript_25007:72-710(+)
MHRPTRGIFHMIRNLNRQHPTRQTLVNRRATLPRLLRGLGREEVGREEVGEMGTLPLVLWTPRPWHLTWKLRKLPQQLPYWLLRIRKLQLEINQKRNITQVMMAQMIPTLLVPITRCPPLRDTRQQGQSCTSLWIISFRARRRRRETRPRPRGVGIVDVPRSIMVKIDAPGNAMLNIVEGVWIWILHQLCTSRRVPPKTTLRHREIMPPKVE